MKKLRLLSLVLLLSWSCSAFAQTTTVWLVRHAEKETTPGNDPDLSADGKIRAKELATVLKNQPIAAVLVTSYKRTAQTGEPTLQRAGLVALQTYNPTDLPALAKQVLSAYSGKTVLIVGHSNTVIPTMEAFGAAKPFDTLVDQDYDLLFKLTIGPTGKATVEISYYGDRHHLTAIPAGFVKH